MKIEKILEYQNLDNELRKLELELVNNADKKMLDKISGIVKETQSISSGLEKEAEVALLEYKKIQKKYNESIKTLENLTKIKDKKSTEEQCVKNVEQINNISVFLSGLEKNIMKLADTINKILSDFDTAKKNYNSAKAKYSKAKENLQKITEEVKPKIEKLEKELKSLEKNIDKEFLTKYKTKRQDKIFPVIVPLVDNSCGRCGMELPSAQIEKLKKDGFLECENCHRIIYFK